MPPPLEPEKREAVLAAIRAGSGARSAGSIAREHEVSRSTVLRIAQDAGLDDAWDRTKTLHASRARAIDAQALRTQLAADHLSDAVRIRERLWEPSEVPTATGQVVMLSLPSARDVRDFMQSVGSALKISMEVERHDQSDQGAADAKSMLLGVAEGLRSLAAGRLMEPADSDEESEPED
jgi:hypothetical protein